MRIPVKPRGADGAPRPSPAPHPPCDVSRSVKLVPLLAYVVDGIAVSRTTITSAATAFTGTALLAADGPLNWGDAFSVAAAAASAMFILRLGEATKTCAGTALNAVSLLTVASLCFASLGALSITGTSVGLSASLSALEHLGLDQLLAIAYLGLVCTALCSWLQAIGQRRVPPQQAAIIYAADPLWCGSPTLLSPPVLPRESI